MELTFPPKARTAPDAPVVCSAVGISRAGAFTDVSLHVRAGEIVALAGLVGSGRSEVARAVFGADRLDDGYIEIAGRRLVPRHPIDAIRAGVGMLPESRKDQGLILGRSVVDNIGLPHLDVVSRVGVVSRSASRKRAQELMKLVDVRASDDSMAVRSLSGGNQQKVMFAKWLFREPKVLVVDEPTRGVDVGAKRAIYELLHRLSSVGTGVLMVSSELEEVIGLAHRVLVMREGRIVAEIDGASVTEEEVMRAAFGASAEVRATA
jgi:ABC-type sugar transport system ATPase subunit